MKKIKIYSIFLIITFLLIIFCTNSRAVSDNTNIAGISKIYNGDEVIYKMKGETGSYNQNVTEETVNQIRSTIKQTIDSLENNQYLVSKIINSNSYYNSENKEFCFKRNSTSSNVDNMEKVIILGYDDNYTFKSDLESKNGAYIVRKIKETEQFYVSYSDTWIESELSIMCDANRIEIDKTSINMKVGETAEVNYTVQPENAISKNIRASYTSNIDINTDTKRKSNYYSYI